MSSLRVSHLPRILRLVYRVQVLEGVGRLPVLLLGPPGIGKTAVVAETVALLAREHGLRVVDLTGDVPRLPGVEVVRVDSLNARRVYEEVRSAPERHLVYMRLVATHLTPEDLQYPRLEDGVIDVFLPRRLSFLTIPGVHGLLFIDEFTNVQREDVKTLFYAIVNEGVVGMAARLSDNVVVVAAGNRPEDSEIVDYLPKPLINRFLVVNVEPPTPEELATLIASCRGCHPCIAAYILEHRVVYEAGDDNAVMENMVTPRSLHRLALLLGAMGEQPDWSLAKALAAGLVGKRGAEIVEYCRLASRLGASRLEEVLSDAGRLEKLSDSELLTLALMAARRVREGRLSPSKLATLMRVLAKRRREYAAVLEAMLSDADPTRYTLLRMSLPGEAQALLEKVVEESLLGVEQ